MNARLTQIAAVFLLSGIGVAEAAPNIPPSELPGRERQRFMETPVERFVNTPSQAAPLIRWKCRDRASPRRTTKLRSKRNKNC